MRISKNLNFHESLILICLMSFFKFQFCVNVCAMDSNESSSLPYMPPNWQSSSHLALKPINVTDADLDTDVLKRNRDVPFTAPPPVEFLPVWKDEINQASCCNSSAFDGAYL